MHSVISFRHGGLARVAVGMLAVAGIAGSARGAVLIGHSYHAVAEVNVDSAVEIPSRENRSEQFENNVGTNRSFAITAPVSAPPDDHTGAAWWSGVFPDENGSWTTPGVGGTFDRFSFAAGGTGSVQFDGTQTPGTDASGWGMATGSIAFTVVEPTRWTWAGEYSLSADSDAASASQLARILILHDVDAETVDTLYSFVRTTPTAGDVSAGDTGVLQPGDYRIHFHSSAYTGFITEDGSMSTSLEGLFTLAAVPEPTALAPLALAAIGLSRRRRAPRRSSAHG